MAKSLVIVESPAKAKTIEKFLGKGYKVLASYGHVRALPSKQGMVDVAHDFEPHYQVLPESSKHIALLRKEVKDADELILATDPDREGEAIAWHLLQALGIDEGAEHPAGQAGHLPRNHQGGDPGRHGRAGTDLPRPGRRPAGPLDPRLPGRLQPLALSLEEDPLRALRRPRPVGGAAPDLRPGEGDRGLRQPGVLDPRRAPRRRRQTVLQGASVRRRRQETRQVRRYRRNPGRRPGAGDYRAGISRCDDSAQREEAQPGRPLHHQHPAAGGEPQARLLGAQDHEHGAEALRGDRHRPGGGRPDHLHANRLGDPLHRRHRRGPRSHHPPVRQGVRPGQAAGLQEQGQERPGGPRGDPPDDHRQHPGAAQVLPLLRPVPPLQADLDAHRRLADGSGDPRCHQRRHRRRRRVSPSAPAAR